MLFFTDNHSYLLDPAADHLNYIVFRDEDLWTVFAGYAPWNNDSLKQLASSGSGFFDLVYYQIYDTIVDRIRTDHP